MTAVLVTGACGFVGLNVVEVLLGQGHAVAGLDSRAPPKFAECAFAGRSGFLGWIEADVRDSGALAAALRSNRIGVLVHGAAITAGATLEVEMAEHVVSVNVGGTAAAVAAAASAGVGRVIAIGTAAVFGDVDSSVGVIEEKQPCRPRSLYAITKRAAEDVALRMGDTFGVEVIVPRLGWLFGRWEHETGVRESVSTLFHITKAALEGRPVILPWDACVDWAPGSWAAGGVAALVAARAPRHRVYNLGPERTFALSDWCRALEGRVPGFRWSVDPNGEGSVPVAAQPGGALLSSKRFRDEFGAEDLPLPADALEAFLAWLALAAELEGGLTIEGRPDRHTG